MLIAFAFIYVMTNLFIQRYYSSGRLPHSDPKKRWKFIFSVHKQSSKVPISASDVLASTGCLPLSFLCISRSILQQEQSLKRPDYLLMMSNNTSSSSQTRSCLDTCLWTAGTFCPEKSYTSKLWKLKKVNQLPNLDLGHCFLQIHCLICENY